MFLALDDGGSGVLIAMRPPTRRIPARKVQYKSIQFSLIARVAVGTHP